MRIVQIEDFFHPDAGYQINVLSKVLAEHGHDVTIVCAENLDIFPESLTSFFGTVGIAERDAAYSERYGVKIVRVPANGYYSGRTFYSASVYRQIESLNPDILFVHGNDSASGLRYSHRAAGLPFPVVMDSHMLTVATRNRFASAYRSVYRRVYAPMINKRGIKVIRVQDDPYVIESLGIDKANAPYIGFGTDTGLFRADAQARAVGREKLGIPQGATVVLYAGKLDESKGGMLLAHALLKRFDDPSLVFVVAGNASGFKAAELEETLSRSENRVVRLPTRKYPELPALYQVADLALYPAQCSLSFYDVQATGLPVVVDDGTPVNTERVSRGNGFQFQAGSVEGLRGCIERYASLGPDARAALKAASIAYIGTEYSYDNVARQYERCFEEVIESFKEGK